MEGAGSVMAPSSSVGRQLPLTLFLDSFRVADQLPSDEPILGL